ncbi:hypothetical protein ACL02R_08825 [Streptomyces sp. MS19]|uniref:hypothetical protein n=1 Tax=Streptomyces sp. MS19 TaxID=3385972 RepID=UPI0039A35A36
MWTERIKRALRREQSARQLTMSCWLFAGFAILEPVVFAQTLADHDPDPWTLTLTGIGTVFFPVMFVVTYRELRRKGRPHERSR